MAKLLHIFYHKEGTFSLLCQQVQYFTLSRSLIYCFLQGLRGRFPVNKLNPNNISFQILPGEFPALADHISMSRTFLRN